MRVKSSLLPVGLAVSLLGLPVAVHAEDAAQADPFRPVQPSWPEGWSEGKAEPAPPKPAPAQAEKAPPPVVEEENEEFTFDDEEPEAPEEQKAEAPPPTPAPPKEVEPAPVLETKAAATQPPANVDLHVPHVWMASGGILIGVSALAALALAISFDEPQLAGGVFALGGIAADGKQALGTIFNQGFLLDHNR